MPSGIPPVPNGSPITGRDAYLSRVWAEWFIRLAQWVSETVAAGGASAWGDITGTLSDQTDLQTELDAKADVSHSHAIADTTGLQAALDAAGDIVEVSSYGSPTALANTAQITAPANQREKRYIAGSGGAVTGVTIATGSGTQELFLVGTDNTNTVQLVSSTNVQLSGTWVASQGSMLALHWSAGLNKWLEVTRNEI